MRVVGNTHERHWGARTCGQTKAIYSWDSLYSAARCAGRINELEKEFVVLTVGRAPVGEAIRCTESKAVDRKATPQRLPKAGHGCSCPCCSIVACVLVCPINHCINIKKKQIACKKTFFGASKPVIRLPTYLLMSVSAGNLLSHVLKRQHQGR